MTPSTHISRNRKRRNRRFVRAAIVGAALLPVAASAAEPAVLTVEGAASTPLSLTAAEFAALPRTSVRWTLHGKAMTCKGPWLADVVARAGAPSGEAVRGPALSTVIVATAGDGYRAVFALGELDHMLGNAPVIVADECDGQPLAAADQRGARSVRQLRRLTITALPDGR